MTERGTIECDIYKSLRHEYMYIYVRSEDGLESVPAALLERFGPNEVTLSLTLSVERRLAREDVEKVMANLEEKGYHLQLPPAKGDPLTE